MRWIKNTDGKQDAVFTMTVISFFVILFKIVLGGVSFSVGESTFTFGIVDSGTIVAFLGPLLTAYVGRRYTDRKYMPDDVAEFDEGDGV